MCVLGPGQQQAGLSKVGTRLIQLMLGQLGTRQDGALQAVLPGQPRPCQASQLARLGSTHGLVLTGAFVRTMLRPRYDNSKTMVGPC